MATKYAVVCSPLLPKWTQSIEDSMADAQALKSEIMEHARGLIVSIEVIEEEEIEEKENGKTENHG